MHVEEGMMKTSLDNEGLSSQAGLGWAGAQHHVHMSPSGFSHSPCQVSLDELREKPAALTWSVVGSLRGPDI